MNQAQKDKAFAKLVKKIETSNEVFKKADRATKILMVAKDVISLMELGRLEPAHRTYFHMPPTCKEGSYPQTIRNVQMSDVLKSPDLPACKVCALGGVLMAATLRLNKVKVSYNNSCELRAFYNHDSTTNTVSVGMTKRAHQVFPDKLLCIMEDAFEEGDYGYKDADEGEDRFRAIYNNLIKNKGKKFTTYNNKEVVYQVSK